MTHGRNGHGLSLTFSTTMSVCAAPLTIVEKIVEDQDEIIHSPFEKQPEVCPMPPWYSSLSHTIEMVAKNLTQLAALNDIYETHEGLLCIDRFVSATVPKVSLIHYLTRLSHLTTSNSIFQVAYFYLATFIDCSSHMVDKNQIYVLTSRNIHRLIAVAFMLACKYLDDYYFSNKVYAQYSGLPLSELNALELEFLFRINFQLFISPKQYEDLQAFFNINRPL